MNGRSVVVFLDTTDRGSDQSARKRRTAASVESVSKLVYMASDCYLHVFHAAVRSGLELVDQLIPECFCESTLRGFNKYFASLAKIANFWRERAADMMRAWDDHHGQSGKDIREMGLRYPMTVSSSRWGSCECLEEFLLERGRTLLEPVMLQVLSKSMRAAPEGHPSTAFRIEHDSNNMKSFTDVAMVVVSD